MLLAELSHHFWDVLGVIDNELGCLLVRLADLYIGNEEWLDLTDILLFSTASAPLC